MLIWFSTVEYIYICMYIYIHICVCLCMFFFMGLTDTNYFLMVELVVADKFQNPS